MGRSGTWEKCHRDLSRREHEIGYGMTSVGSNGIGDNYSMF